VARARIKQTMENQVHRRSGHQLCHLARLTIVLKLTAPEAHPIL
jgi:hypothetical protein